MAGFAVSPLLMVLGLGDPAPSLLRTKEASWALECERMSVDAALADHPGLLLPVKPRGDGVERDVLVCAERVMAPGARDPVDEAALTDLRHHAAELAGAAAAADLGEVTWLVDAHHASAQVAAKISFATKTALMDLGLAVSDRVPLLGAADLDVLTRMPPSQSYALACQRYAQTGALADGQALIAVTPYDPRSTALHAGVCHGGAWRWLR